jgi:hypothetical protein
MCVEAEGLRASSELHNIGGYGNRTEGTFAGNGNFTKNAEHRNPAA